MEAQKIEFNKELTVAKISGRWGLRRRLKALKIEQSSKITFLKTVGSNKLLLKVDGVNRKKILPDYFLNFIELLDANDSQFEEKMESISSNIAISVFSNTEQDVSGLFQPPAGTVLSKYNFNISYLPAVDSIYGSTYEQKKLRNTVLNEFPDLFLGIIDAEDLYTGLSLTTQFIDMDAKLVLLLKNSESAKKIDVEQLSIMIGAQIIVFDEFTDKDLDNKVQEAVLKTHFDSLPFVRHIHVNYGRVVENSINKIIRHLKRNEKNDLSISPRYTAINLLEKDSVITNIHKKCNNCEKTKCFAEKQIDKLESLYNDKVQNILYNARKAYVNGAITEVKEDANGRGKLTKKLDRVFTHRIFGIPLFLLFMFIMFFTTFEIGKYPMEWLEDFIDWLSAYSAENIPYEFWNDLVVNGALGGIGGVLVFLPNIFILFFFIGILENSGYMSRAAFVMDKYMHKIGLHGKSFIPMIMGFGCTVPAILSTRILENRRDRILTMLILPFFSCSARLPVYILLIAAFFPSYPILMLFIIYLIGITIAAITSKLFSQTILKQHEAPYIMELRPYTRPTLKISLYYMWNRGKEFLKKIGGIILVGSIVIWALGYYPKEVDFSRDYDELIAKAETEEEIAELRFQKQSEHHEKSYIGRLGHFIEPAVRPLGFDWKMSIGILSGIAGKEITVSTMGVLYQVGEDADETSYSLQEKIKSEVYTSGPKKGQKVFNPIVALSFILFVLIYFPCIAVVATIWRESKRFVWGLFSVVYTTILAWLVSFAVYQIGSALFL